MFQNKWRFRMGTSFFFEKMLFLCFNQKKKADDAF
jgi:hypothetical protein